MKRQTKQLTAFLLVLTLFAGLLFLPCGNSIAAAKFKLSRTKTTLYKGDTETLMLLGTTAKQEKKIVWSSSKKAVVTVKKGKITAKKPGKATVTAKLFGKKYNCKVTVKKPQITYVEVTPPEEPAADGNQLRQNDVTAEMTTADFWAGKTKDPDAVLMDQDQIAAQNQRNYNDKSTQMVDLKNKDMSIDGSKFRADAAKSLIDDVKVGRIGTHDVWRDGTKLSADQIDSWFDSMKANIENAPAPASRQYAICTERADQWMAPSNALVGWSKTDADDEFLNSSINVNEPVIINMTTADGKFCLVNSNNCSGWVEADHFAVCDSKEDWLAQWELKDDEVLVVTGSHVVLEQSNLAPKTSAVDLYLGTQLPLVPKAVLLSDTFAGVSERYPWYSYTVYLPTRGEDGKLVREMALISSHHEVSIGYPKMTKRNILKVAFSCLGDRYGWGGMLGAMDCSMYTRSIYRCFGLELARNTTWQAAMPCWRLDLTALASEAGAKEETDEAKAAAGDKAKAGAISALEPGSLLMFSGHITMYLGEEGGKQYVISDLGSLSESVGELKKISVYDVAVNSLDVHRMNGNTWLREMKWAICPFKEAQPAEEASGQ